LLRSMKGGGPEILDLYLHSLFFLRKIYVSSTKERERQDEIRVSLNRNGFNKQKTHTLIMYFSFDIMAREVIKKYLMKLFYWITKTFEYDVNYLKNYFFLER
jgi:hypothetical protein